MRNGHSNEKGAQMDHSTNESRDYAAMVININGVSTISIYAHQLYPDHPLVPMILAKLHNFYTKSVDFVQTYPQANIKSSIYLHPPAGVVLNDNDGGLILKLMNHLYGLKDAS